MAKKLFSPLTLQNNWVEDRKMPGFPGVVPHADSEAAIRMLESAGRTLPTVGAALLSRDGQASPPKTIYRSAQARPDVAAATQRLFSSTRPGVDDFLAKRAGLGATAASASATTAHSSTGSRRLEAEEDVEFSAAEERTDSAAGAGAGGGAAGEVPSSLPPAQRYDPYNVMAPDRLYPAGTWASLNASTHFGADNTQKADAKEFKPKSHAAAEGHITTRPEVLAAYRHRWTNDQATVKMADRFASTMLAATSAAVPGRYRSGGARFVPGSVKAFQTLREKTIEKHGADSAWMLARGCPSRYTLAQLHKWVAKAPVDVHLTVDEGKELFAQLALERKLPETLELLAASAKGSCPTTADGLLRGDPADKIQGSRELFLEALLGHELVASRTQYVDTVWSLLLRLAGGDPAQVTVAHLRKYYDAAVHPDVTRHRRLTAKEAAARFRQALYFVLEGEPAAPAPVVRLREAAAAAAEAEEAAAAAAARSAPAALQQAAAEDESTQVSYAAFLRYCEYISAGITADADFASSLAACWHLDEAAGILGGPRAGAGRTAMASAELLAGTGALSPGAIRARVERERLAATPLSAPAQRAGRATYAAGLLAATATLKDAAATMAATSPRLGLSGSGSLGSSAGGFGSTVGSTGGAAGLGSTSGSRTSGAAAKGPVSLPPKTISGAAYVGSEGLPLPLQEDPALAHVAVLVTHTSGRRSMTRIPRDRFLRLHDEADIRARLASVGVQDVASFSLDF